ncbi:MAG TPA: succinate dehydrogenase [Casimicrobiaceae bacterium]|nr:succinate dehydrogenase [Casimicrobiaceae bacterium]
MNTPLSSATPAPATAAAAGDALAMRQARRWYWQRIAGMVLALCVLVHLVTIVYAVHSGLSAEALLARTRGNPAFAAFYVVFVLACAVHVPIGLANVAEEWMGMPPRAAHAASNALAWLLAALGLVAVYAMVTA